MALTSALVHQSAIASPILRRRHTGFIARRLGVAFVALGAAPIFLASHGAPSTLETVAFACSFAPLAAALVAGRTGRLALAHLIAGLGLAALGLGLYVLGCGATVLAAWLLASVVEAVLSGDRRVTAIAALLSFGALAGVAIAQAFGVEPLATAPTVATVFSGIALAYALVVSLGEARADEQPAAGRFPFAIRDAASALLDELIVGLDAAGSVTHVAMAATDRLGFSAAELTGRGLFEHVHITDRPAFLKHIAEAAHDGITATMRVRLRRPQANEGPSRPGYAWVELRLAPVSRRLDEELTTVVAQLRDVDDAHAQEVETVAAHSTMEEAIQSRDQFLANMSHELRTPLNAIIGFSEVLGSHTLRPADGERQREYARIIHQSGHHLLSVVNSILDMSKIRSGTFAVVPAAFDVVPLLDLACDMIALKADQGRVRLVRDYSETLEEIVGDKRACKQILINLLSNAVKFTPEHGEVELSARPDGNFLAITVKDNGIGIGAADLDRLGDPFFQACASAARPFEGTGLGLSVVRGLVGLHGGEIAIESELGRGTCVRVHLPLDCRIIGEKSGSAKIETLARRQPIEPLVSCIDRRMKQIA